jgi:peptidoglycan/xylan/chitin deacetylase (PgdA/CDA1 family)
MTRLQILIGGLVLATTGLGIPAAGSLSSPTPAAGATTTSGYIVPTNLRGIDFIKIPTTRKIVALTFDAGANADGQASIMRTLAAKNAKGTFFLTGKWAARYPNYSKNIWIKGHKVGNHSQTHPDFTKLTVAQQQQEIRAAAKSIQLASGRVPRPWFRFPFGARTSANIKVANNEGYVAARWTVDTLGWKGTSEGITVTSIRNRVLSNLTPGMIILMHVGSHPTDRSTLDADALPSLIDALRARGYGFVYMGALWGP